MSFLDFFAYGHYLFINHCIPIAIATSLTTKAQIHAMPHWATTIPIAHLPPSSLLIDAIAATHGVYKRQNTKSEIAPSGVIFEIILLVVPSNTDKVETTLSLAIKPAISAVEILQSPNPKGTNRGAINPAITASMLS